MDSPAATGITAGRTTPRGETRPRGATRTLWSTLMAGRLAIDFGTSNTVVAVWDEEAGEGVPLVLPDYARELSVAGADGAFEAVPVIPSLIHYAEGDQWWVGEQVHTQGLYEDAQTSRWMKRYIARRTPTKLRLADGREVTPADAGRDFLSAVLAAAANGVEIDPAEEEVALTVPVESFEHYDQWLLGVAEAVGIARPRLIDEASAAAIGYGAHVQPNDVYLIFDFGGGTLDVSVVLVEEEDAEGGGGVYRRCRVLGKAGADLGGATVDQWIYQDVLRHAGVEAAAEDVRRLSRKLLVDCERAKELLSVEASADVSVLDIFTGYSLSAEYTRTRFEEMLGERGLFTTIDRTIRRALNAARDRGYDEDQIKAAFMLGGTSMIPSVQQALTRTFGGDRVMIDRPLDAVACGAAAFAAGVDVVDHIQHDYAIRYVDPAKGAYDYRPIVRRGTQYPTAEPVAKVVVKASHEGQNQLGIAVFEVGQPGSKNGDDGQKLELVFDPTGAARVQAVTGEEQDRRSHFWVNEQAPTFLTADPPGATGEPRFEVHFGVDANKRLVLSAKDVRTGDFVYQDVPVVKLS
jgi:molecular chaperone DnaK